MADPGGVRSIAWRAALAVLLMFGFYALALGVAAALVALPIALFPYAKALTAKIAIFCFVGAFLILRAILPRRDRFVPPGPPLTPGRHPRLFAELRELASAARQPMPVEVFLIPDVNAFVAHRGGVMGVGAHEVMGLGLPLLQALRVSELRAVVAHEFGHYLAGDVKLGPWVYKTREALVRTVIALAGHSGALTRPFQWYATLFFRVSHAVSRQQELQADALSVRVAGAAAVAGGLRATHRAGLAFRGYWPELRSVLGAGFLPPVADGFARFMSQPAVVEGLRDALDREMREGKPDPYDTHPPLRERLAALPAEAAAAPAAAGADASEPLALSLLDDVAAMERELMLHLKGARGPERLDDVRWEDVPASVYIPNWRKFLAEHGSRLAGLTPVGLIALHWAGLGKRLALALHQDDDPVGLADFAVGAALVVALADRQFTLHAAPGAPPVLIRDGVCLEPFRVRAGIEAPGGPDGWRDFCAQTGIAEVDLGALVPRQTRA